MDDTRGSVAPVNQPVALITQWWWEVPGPKLLVADVVDAGTDHVWQDVWIDLCSWLERGRARFNFYWSTLAQLKRFCFGNITRFVHLM